MSKKILLLGGNHVQMTAIEAAKSQGYYVITADYLPDNPGHKLADEYYNISTIDKEAILQLARRCKIDGIVSYASDVSAPTAAYVAEKLGLPTNPFESVMILTHKNLFREFMYTHGYPMPKWKMFINKDDAWSYIKDSNDIWMIKPVDSSGSKGVTKLTKLTQFDEAWDLATRYSISKQVIIEQFIEKTGYQIDGDIFVENGEIVFWGICDQHNDRDCAPFVPIGLSYPSTQSIELQNKAKNMVASILKELHMTMGAFNVEYVVGQDNQIYILEIGPRNGGNLIPDTILLSTGYSMPINTIRQAVGDQCVETYIRKSNYCSSYIIHSQKDGVLHSVSISSEISGRILKELRFIEPNSMVQKFTHGGCGIGIVVFQFDSLEQMCDIIDNMNEFIQVNVC